MALDFESFDSKDNITCVSLSESSSLVASPSNGRIYRFFLIRFYKKMPLLDSHRSPGFASIMTTDGRLPSRKALQHKLQRRFPGYSFSNLTMRESGSNRGLRLFIGSL